jgi:hypothetical protein
MTIFKLLLWWLPVAVNVIIDRKGKKPNYLIVNILRGIAAIVHGAIFFSGDTWENRHEWTDYATLILFQLTSFWLLFEVGLNLIRIQNKSLLGGLTMSNLLYYDTKEKDSGWVDLFFTWTGKGVHLGAKLAALYFCIWSFVKLIKI